MRTCKYRANHPKLTKDDQIWCQARDRYYRKDKPCTSKCTDYRPKLNLDEKLQQKSLMIAEYIVENPSLKFETRGLVRPCKWCARMKENGFMHCLHCGVRL